MTMGTVTQLEEVRWKRRDPRELMATELRRVAAPVTEQERHELAGQYRARADALEAAAEDVILFDTESMLLGLARRYRQLSHYLDEGVPAA
ncbi:MAG TPA: hypothetical protein VGK90_12600 [Rhizomicrobium sp.]